ncbi:MAG: YaiI/YqxD family protein [Treponema sp.]
MKLFVDADSCPVRIREIISKTAYRLRTEAIFVANRLIAIPENAFCTSVITSTDPQAADSYITAHATPGDLVITRDIPLAKLLIDAHICVINDRGAVYTAENIGERLSLRNFMYDLHANGLMPERSKTFGKKDIAAFAQALDRETRRLIHNNP